MFVVVVAVVVTVVERCAFSMLLLNYQRHVTVLGILKGSKVDRKSLQNQNKLKAQAMLLGTTN